MEIENKIIDIYADENFRYKFAIILLKEFVEEGLLTQEEFETSDRELRKLYNIKKETPLY